MDLKEFKKLPLLGILRGIKEKDVRPIAESSVAAGLKTIEVAMNTPGACKMIRLLKKASMGKMAVGAGTVLDMKTLKKAIASGASFIVSPVFVPEIVSFCVREKIPVFPGAFTPQEIYNAWEGGASMVKVFPAKFQGPAYIKEIKGPFKNIELLACGGVSTENLRDFFESGASAAAFGESVFKKEWIARKRFDRMENALGSLVRVCKASLAAFLFLFMISAMGFAADKEDLIDDLEYRQMEFYRHWEYLDKKEKRSLASLNEEINYYNENPDPTGLQRIEDLQLDLLDNMRDKIKNDRDYISYLEYKVSSLLEGEFRPLSFEDMRDIPEEEIPAETKEDLPESNEPALDSKTEDKEPKEELTLRKGRMPRVTAEEPSL